MSVPAGVKVLRQVKKFLTEHLNVSHWEDYESDPTMVILSFDRNSHLVLGENGDKIRVFIHGRYSSVYSSIDEWERAIATMTPADAAFHIWLMA